MQRALGGHWRSQGDHKVLGEHSASSPFEVVSGPFLNSGFVIRRPIYQQTHGPRTVRHRLEVDKGNRLLGHVPTGNCGPIDLRNQCLNHKMHPLER